jgi:hypothetical protein
VSRVEKEIPAFHVREKSKKNDFLAVLLKVGVHATVLACHVLRQAKAVAKYKAPSTEFVHRILSCVPNVTVTIWAGEQLKQRS